MAKFMVLCQWWSLWHNHIFMALPFGIGWTHVEHKTKDSEESPDKKIENGGCRFMWNLTVWILYGQWAVVVLKQHPHSPYLPAKKLHWHPICHWKCWLHQCTYHHWATADYYLILVRICWKSFDFTGVTPELEEYLNSWHHSASSHRLSTNNN